MEVIILAGGWVPSLRSTIGSKFPSVMAPIDRKTFLMVSAQISNSLQSFACGTFCRTFTSCHN